MSRQSTLRKLRRSVQFNSTELPTQLLRILLSHRYPQIANLVGRFGGTPNFLIIGTQKGGTTSLYSYLAAHPKISASLIKEIHYFDFHYGCSDDWYKAHFAPPWWLNHQGKLTGEASPYYLFAPAIAARVATLVPDAKIIVLLREPVRRAYSQYHMSVRKQIEPHSFGEAIGLEKDRLALERRELGEEAAYASGQSHRYHSYVSRGHYAEQLTRWFEHFPREQILVLKSETFFAEPARVYNEVQAFLRIPHYDLPSYRTFNDASYEQIEPGIREQLETYFAPHNAHLEALLGRTFWAKTEK